MSEGGMKEMAELLKSGARMLDRSCPECGSPLFRLKSGEIWCANCQRRVVIVQEGEEAAVETGLQLEPVERALVSKIASLSALLEGEDDPTRLKETSEALDTMLTSLERLRRIRKG